MHRLFPEKLVTIITSDVLEETLIKKIRKRGASGYTIVRARGAGSWGEQTGMLSVDTNMMIKVVMPPENLPRLLDSLERLMKSGHHLTVFVADVGVLGPEKYAQPIGD